MPNWCSTKMYVYGESDELSRFLAGMNTKNDEWGHGVNYEILQSYYPCPSALVETVATIGFKNDFDNEIQSMENIANYGYKDWYDWSCAKWGTKWGDCGTSLLANEANCLTFTLRSAWSPITTGLLEVSKQFPTLTFVMYHDEEAGFYLVGEVIQNGELVYEVGCAPCEEYEFTETDDEDGDVEEWEQLESWKDERIQEFKEEINAYIPFLGGTR